MADIDRISELPEEILLHILSFLPTEDVFATSLVSKKWRPLWLSVPTLDFDQYRYLKRQREKQQQQQGCCFVNFVSATILARRGGLHHQPIKGFRLSCDDDHELYAKQWVTEAIELGVENVELDNYPEIEFPSNIFSCTTLVVLKLCYATFGNCFSSVTVNLPSLKTLHLRDVDFEKYQEFVEFLYGCPILENLVADYVSSYDSSFQGKFKSLPKLVTADVCNLEECYIPVKVFSNVKFLRLDKCDEDIPVFSNLIHAELVELKWNSVLNILMCSPNLQAFVLKLSYSVCEDWPNPQFVPECFSSQLKKCIIQNYTSRENQISFVKYVMQNSTSLRTMAIRSNHHYRNNHHKKLRREKRMLLKLVSGSATCELLFK